MADSSVAEAVPNHVDYGETSGRKAGESATTSDQPIDILFKAICMEEGKQDKEFFSSTRFNGIKYYEPNLCDSKPASIIEVIIGATGKDKTGRSSEILGGDKSISSNDFEFGKDFEVYESSRPTIHIHSLDLQKVLRRIIQYYPSQTLSGRNVVFSHPYAPVVHYWDELKSFKRICDTSVTIADGNEISADRSDPTGTPNEIYDPRTTLALKVLLDFLEPFYTEQIGPELQRHKQSPPVATFDMLWMLFKPGEDVYMKMDGKIAGFVVQEALFKPREENSAVRPRRHLKDKADRWIITLWDLVYAEGKVSRHSHKFSIPEFHGEREILSLDIYPSKFLDATDEGATRKNLVKRGRYYFGLLEKAPVHKQYSGIPLSQEGREQRNHRWKYPKWYDGQVIIDPKSYDDYAPRGSMYAHCRRKRSRSPSSDSEDSSDDEKLSREPSDFGGGPRWSQYDGIDPKSAPKMSDHQLFLLPSAIGGYGLEEKLWMTLDIEFVQPIQWPNPADCAINQLILSPEKDDIGLLKALLSQHNSSRKHRTWTVDSVPGKGASLVILLAGPPGTGKSFTVECLAEYTRRPLLCLTMADLEVSQFALIQMMRMFTLAEHWGAIFQIDEVDVFLEKRNYGGLFQNGLVSVFLHSMEYFRGTLFLTTNRLGHMDEALLSRVNIAINLYSLEDNTRKNIWNNFLQKLKKDRPDISVTERAMKFLHTDESCCVISNGRDIRNILQTALALATSDADERSPEGVAKIIEVLPEHFEKVIDRRNDLMEYAEGIHEMDQERLALAEGLRPDRRVWNRNKERQQRKV